MHKNDLWCCRCGTQEFIEDIPEYARNKKHPEWYASWECTHCHAGFQDNPGYGYFAAWPGEDYNEKFSCCTGEIVDENKMLRTPEGIIRHSDSKAELESYLARTQVK